MKRRKGVTVFSTFTLVFAILGAAAFVVIMLLLDKLAGSASGGAEEIIKKIQSAFDIVARNKDIINSFTDFSKFTLVPQIISFAFIGVFVVSAIIWLIVDLLRKRKIVFFFLVVYLLALYVTLIQCITVLPLVEDILKYKDQQPLILVPAAGLLLGALATLFGLVLFFVDLGTGRVEKQESPTFIKEPTEEVKEGVFEEVKDENEVAPAPAKEEEPVKEEKVEEVELEEVEEEKEEKPAKKPSAPKKVKKPEPKKEEKKPAKKAPAKKEEKKAPAKKAEPKKEEAKKAPAKKAAPVKEEAPKDDARKTQTILLQNDEGNTYAKAFHVSRRPELNKWQVKATGSDKALKLFNTQKEAIEYANQLAKNQNVSVRVHSKEGKIRKVNG